ncbi:MAG: UbiD family decarboxylase [Actinomycetota bacterium]|nr:MAG: UbiD family decarboxylase [Actinomycetota bacterium]
MSISKADIKGLSDELTKGADSGLRDWLGLIDGLGQLRRVSGADADSEIGAAADVLQQVAGAPAAIFDRIPGYNPEFRVLVNSFGHTDRIALTLGLPLGLSKVALSDVWREKIRTLKYIPPKFVKDGPIFENVVRGNDIDLTMFPAPKWHSLDGGRYIGTGSFDVTRDPDDGWVNLGTYRVMVHDSQNLGYYISPGKHGRMHRQKYFERGERCPVAMVFGSDPLQFLASSTEIPLGVCEYDWVGGVRGRAVDVIEGPVTGLPIPADAEIVVEGFASSEDLRVEGPFGEWTGYYGSSSRVEPVLHVEALYYRNQPILVGAPPGQPPDELSRYRAVLRSALLRDELDRAGIPDVAGAWQHEVGGSRLFTVVAINQRYPGHSREVLHLASQSRSAAYMGRYTIVVDDDIDPSNLEEVMWAVCTRSDPATSIDVVKRAWSSNLDPRLAPEEKAIGNFVSSRALIDATRPWEWRDKFPPVNVPSRDVREASRNKWAYLLQG